MLRGKLSLLDSSHQPITSGRTFLYPEPEQHPLRPPGIRKKAMLILKPDFPRPPDPSRSAVREDPAGDQRGLRSQATSSMWLWIPRDRCRGGACRCKAASTAVPFHPFQKGTITGFPLDTARPVFCSIEGSRPGGLQRCYGTRSSPAPAAHRIQFPHRGC